MFFKNKNNIKLVIFYAGVFIFSFAAATVSFNRRAVTAMGQGGEKGCVAIVIDDFGYGGEGTEEMLALDIPLTCALMPFSKESAEDAEKIRASGKDMIIHMPMESTTGKKSWVGDKGLFLNMTDDEIRMRLEEAFDAAEGAVGLNNHMGSAIMEDERCLSIVMDEVKKRDMLFLDSRTTPDSKAEELSKKFGTCLLGRDVFLDSTDDIEVVKDRLRQAAAIAEKNGAAIAIGHVGPEGGMVTVDAIKELKEEIEGMGIKFVTISEMKNIQCGSSEG